MGQRRWWRVLPLALALLAVSGLWLGCSPKKHYKLLSFFFDGVPDPNALPPGAAVQGADGRVILLNVMHKPYQQNQCDACHTSRNAFENISTPTDDKCLKCHDQVMGRHTYVHGPVAAAQCLWCHDPHRSNVPALLRRPAGQLCRECHTPELLSRTVPGHTDPAADCLKCHTGHGGNDRYFLTPGAAVPATRPAAETPATQPVTEREAP